MKTDEGYELIKGLIETRAASDPKVRSLLDRIASGDADFKTTSEYSRIVSEILGTSLSEHILDLDDAAREEVCRMLLHDRYEDINDVLAEVQTSLDAKTGINIRPKKPPFQSERVASFAHSLADHTVVDQVIKRRARNGSANISMSDHDRYMKTNAELRNKAGLKCYIERETDGKCCEWCTKMAGRYAYPDDTPKDVFRRHDNCGCSVTYKNGRQRQDVWSKKTWEADKDERINKASEKEPTAFTKVEAQAKQSEILARKELTYDDKRGIIYYRKGKSHRRLSSEGRQIIDKPTYNKIVNPAIKRGADIRLADEVWTKHLEEEKSRAVTIGDVIYFRPDATVSDVLEEVHHFYQNRNGLNAQYGVVQRTVMNEIDAKKYLLTMTEKYHIPPDEVYETEYWLKEYIKQMEEMKKRGEWNE